MVYAGTYFVQFRRMNSHIELQLTRIDTLVHLKRHAHRTVIGSKNIIVNFCLFDF